MAVPLSGPLSQLKMAREAKHADYNGSQSMGTISLYDLVNGGQANGSTVDYPAINTGCLPNPANRASLQLTNVGEGMGGGAARTLYYNANIGAASNLTAGDQLYTNSNLTTAEGTSFNGQPGSSATTTACGAGNTWYFDTNSNGVIQQNVLCQ